MEWVLKFLAENAKYYQEGWWFFLLALAVFAIMGFSGEKLPVYVFFYGNRTKAAKYDHQIYGFQGFCRFFFWLALIVNAPFAVLALGYLGWELLSGHS